MRLRLIATAACLVVFSACGDDDSGDSPPASSLSQAPIPANWPTYSDPGHLYTLRYPPHWIQDGASLYSKEPTRAHGFTPETIEIEIGYYTASGSSTCGGAISVDPANGSELGPLPGATSINLGGIPAWHTRRIAAEGDFIQGSEQGLNRVEGIAAVFNGYCVIVTGYFVQENPDVDIFNEIVSTFEFAY